ncbi:hypothetical protein [Antrihabitans cavernicola]|uniref:Uncharacterized protein n=1 Tax=Antrihabitans cavernicola TaxID=2495913 RepID=A0A5A7SFS0_9NOCA|nr:hypothetical protein [Spelaeibacter cavernicola]KAA0024988.1 hypothetical protein FOY51_03490 [Spelaeibacter cavernicola]
MGQGDAIAMYNAAVGGTLKIEQGVAQACATRCEELFGVFDDQMEVAQRLSHNSGFGGFGSARELQVGFDGKGHEAVTMLRAYREAALRFQAAFLAAGQQFDAADAINARVLGSVAQGIDS